jgi:hypothetical protein
MAFRPAPFTGTVNLSAGDTVLSTPNNDTALTYTAGSIDGLAGNDTITATHSALQTALTAGDFIDGGAGVDTLKLAVGTTLDLTAITGNQTVKTIQEVEVLQMQGNSALTLNANDVLSLGGSNASTMSTYTFASTTGGSASASSTGKVQMVINGTSSDALTLKSLTQDGVTTNGAQGNTGLAGEWTDMGTTVISGTTYRVYNHSTTEAQVLSTVNASLPNNVIAFSSMTKDSGPAGATADWLTADASAGRLVSGTVATPLAAGDVVKVYANGTLMGNATVNAAGTAWEITDTNGYNTSWTYRADVVSSSNAVIGSSTQAVATDFSESAPVITAVVDASSTNVANAGTTTNALSTVSGTGNAGDTIYLYDNSSTNLVGSTVVGADGKWTVAGLNTSVGVGAGSNIFSAKQVDVLGNESVLSNLWTVNGPGVNALSNGDFSAGKTGFASGLNSVTGQPINGVTDQYNLLPLASLGQSVGGTGAGVTTITTGTATAPVTYGNGLGTWSKKAGSGMGSPDGTFSGDVMTGQLSNGAFTIWKENVDVVAGKEYIFKFDYTTRILTEKMSVTIDGAKIIFATLTFESGHFTATYVAPTTKKIEVSVGGSHISPEGGDGDFALDNFNFLLSAGTNTLVAGATPPGTPNNDTALTYTAGSIDGLAGNDTITAGTDIQAKLAAGGYINGGAGVDTLKLAAGTTLDLTAITGNQTVKPIQEVEVFEMQGNSALTLSANDVLSLGGSNASTMSAYSFSTTTQMAFGSTAATGSTSSTGKVQFVVNGTTSDLLTLDDLNLDGVTTNSTLGNTGLAGQWQYKGTTDITVGGVITTYRVYDHSTTAAQVLVDNDIAANTVTITSVESSAKSYVEEFDNAVGGSVKGWTVAQTNTTTGATTSNFAIQGGGSNYANVGTDAHIFVNPSNTQTTGYNRTLTFTSKMGPFNSISFIHADLQGPQGALPVKFYDDAGTLVASTTLSTFGQGVTFSYTLPAGVTATSFALQTTLDDLWVIDTLTAGVTAGTSLSNGSGTIDTTPFLRGTYAGDLNAGDVVKVYDGATEIGTATLDTAAKTWSYQVGTAASIGSHTYTAKIVSAASQVITTSSSFSLNVLASPLVLDLNGDGVQTLGIEQGVQFDMLATGTAQQVGWVDKNDGLLVMDLNQDGMVNTGAELLGTSTQLADGSLARDGWQALAQYDLNTDGVIDAKDAAFADLKVWVDADSDGVSDAGELKTLANAGLRSINLAHDAVETAQNGNVLQGFSSFTTSDGQSHQIVDAWVQTSAPAAGAATFNLVNAKADTLNLSLTDVLKTAANTDGQHVVQVRGDAGDTVNLSNLLDMGAAQGNWQASGAVVQGGVTYNAYSHSADASLQVLIDQHITQVHAA